jgi:hypothetical protein
MDGTILVICRTISSRATGTMVFARIAAASGSGGLGLSVGVEHPMYGVLGLAGLSAVVLAFVVLAVCLPDERSERLYRWARLILGREEPKEPSTAGR